MAGVKFKSFPLRRTWIFAAVFISTLFWNSIIHDIWSSFLLSLLELLLFCSFVASLVSTAVCRTRVDLHRLMSIAVAVGSMIPVITLGGEIRERLILHSLPDFQRMTDQLAAGTPDFEHIDARFASTPTERYTLAQTPKGWSCLVRDNVSIFRHKDGSLSVWFMTEDSGFIRRMLIYCSNDDPQSFYPDWPLKRIAPKWFTFTWYS